VQLVPAGKLSNGLLEDNMTIDCRQVVRAVALTDCQKFHGEVEDTMSYRMFHWENHGMVLAVGLRNGRIRIYDTSSGKILLELIDHTDQVTKLSFAPDQSLTMASCSWDGTLKFWDLSDDGNMYKSFKVGDFTDQRGITYKLSSLAWSPDAKRVAVVGTFKSVMLFDTVNRKFLLKCNGHCNYITSCDFATDGVLLVTASVDTTAIVWNSYNGTMMFKLGHQFPAPSEWFPGEDDTKVSSCRFRGDGLEIVTVADDGYVRFWDLTQPEFPVSVCSVEDPLCCSVKPGGELVAVGNQVGSVTMAASASNPQSLSHMCRIKTNFSLLGQNNNVGENNNVDHLAIPSTLKMFLKYENMQL